MAYSKIILNGETLIDVTNDTVDAEDLLSGETATKNNGTKVTGTIATKSSSDLTVSGATVTVPSGYYSASTSKSVASGTTGTPIATKGTVSNNSVSVTPSVTNTTGYITGGTKTGTAVSVSASELVSGTKNITSAGTWGVTNNAYVSVPSGNFTPSATKGTVSNNSVLVTPSATSTAGFVDAQTKTGTAVTVSASELVSGTKTIIANGTDIDVTNYASVDVNVSPTHKATIIQDGVNDSIGSIYCYVYYNGTRYYTKDDTFDYSAGTTLEITIQTYDPGTREMFEDGVSIAVSDSHVYTWRYNYTLPDYDVDIILKKVWDTAYGSAEIKKSGSGGAKNYVEGTFIYDSGGIKTLNIPYTGNGYPILIDIHVSDGMYDTTSDWYSLVNRYKVGQYSFVKGIINTAPDYNSSTYDINSGLAMVCYKNSTSDATTYAFNPYNTTQVFTSSSPSASYVNREVTMQNATQMKLAVGQTQYSFAMNIEYTYHIVYSE